MNRAIGFGTDPPHFALVDTVGDDGLGDEPARFELRPFRLFRGVGLLRLDLNILAAGDDLAAILCLAVGRADLDNLRLRCNLLLDVRLQFRRIAGWIGTLCGIRATGKCFPLARRRRAPRVRMQAVFAPGGPAVPQVSKQ